MADIEKLSWSASADKDWINVYPTEGEGSTDVTITVMPATYEDTETNGTVTFICNSCNPPLTTDVNVSRCEFKCEYETTSYKTEYTFQEKSVEACDTSISFTVPKIDFFKSTNGCPDKEQTGIEDINETFEENETSKERTVKEVEGKYRIIQKAGPCTPVDCGCSNITVNHTSMEWEWDDRTESSATISISDECSSVITINSTTATGNFTATLNRNKTKIIVKPNGENGGTTDFTGSVNITYNDTKTCESVIQLVQKHKECKNITITPDKNLTCKGGIVTFNAIIS